MAFTAAAGEQRPAKRRPAPFSLRLSGEERQRLINEAGDVPLGSYIKGRLLDQGVASIRSRRSGMTVDDRQALARALALLGQSRFSSNLNQLAHLANLGLLAMTDEERLELAAAIAYIAELRRLLVQALGPKARGA